MKNFTAIFWRGNPQLKNGGYETIREIKARGKKSAEKKAREYERDCSYGTMTLVCVIERVA